MERKTFRMNEANIQMKFRCLLGICTFLAACAPTAPRSLLERVTLAPTAVTIPLERQHQDVLDARAPLDTFVCLRMSQEMNLELKVEVEGGLAGELILLSPSGQVLDKKVMNPARRFYSVRGWGNVGNPSQCAQFKLESGWSLDTLK